MKMIDFLNVGVVASVVSLVISIFSSILLNVITKHDTHYLKFKVNKIGKISIVIQELKDQLDKEKKYLDENNVDGYLKVIADQIKLIYPKITVRISIRLVESIGEEITNNSKVYLWYTYPYQEQYGETECVIKDNTDFSAIVDNKSDYFFVSDLKEFSVISQYHNSSKNFLHEYNSSIVCPICRKEKGEKYDLTGFLCVDSPQKLNNVKKNEMVINFVKLSASVLYEYIIQNKDNSDFYL